MFRTDSCVVDAPDAPEAYVESHPEDRLSRSLRQRANGLRISIPPLSERRLGEQPPPAPGPETAGMINPFFSENSLRSTSITAEPTTVESSTRTLYMLIKKIEDRGLIPTTKSGWLQSEYSECDPTAVCLRSYSVFSLHGNMYGVACSKYDCTFQMKYSDLMKELDNFNDNDPNRVEVIYKYNQEHNL